MKFFKKFDFLSHKATLTFNEKGEIGYRTFIGGVISIFSILSSLCFCLYFLYRMFGRKDLSVVHSTQLNPFVNLTYSHKLPFLLRLTDTNSIPYNEDEKLYYVSASVWYGGSNDTTLSGVATQYSVSLNVSKCDINKHFTDEYKEYFKNFTDLNSYYCLEPRNSSQTIYGLYGNIYPFSYYSFTARYCKNSTENNNSCYSLEKIEDTIEYTFLDIIFIDYVLNSFKNNNENELFIRRERYELSSKLFKRIWIYFENIKYIVDKGYIFENQKNIDFHHFYYQKSDYNIIKHDFFCTLTILNNSQSSVYKKYYSKIQDYLATIGGLLKAISLISSVLNYYNSQNSYYLKLIKDFIIENKDLSSTIKDPRRHSRLFNTNFIKSDKILFLQDSNDNLVQNKTFNKCQTKRNENNYNDVNSSLSTKILPSFFCNNNRQEFLTYYKEFINTRLNVFNILKKLETIKLSNELKKKSKSDQNPNGETINNNKLKIKLIK